MVRDDAVGFVHGLGIEISRRVERLELLIRFTSSCRAFELLLSDDVKFSFFCSAVGTKENLKHRIRLRWCCFA